MKGVMDQADPRKDDRFKPFAASASAEVLHTVLVGRFDAAVPRTDGTVSQGAKSTSLPQSKWKPRTLEGLFLEDLLAAL